MQRQYIYLLTERKDAPGRPIQLEVDFQKATQEDMPFYHAHNQVYLGLEDRHGRIPLISLGKRELTTTNAVWGAKLASWPGRYLTLLRPCFGVHGPNGTWLRPW